MDKKVYVTDFVGDEYLQWKDGDAVIISTPTGSGKTTFVISKLLQYAVEQKKHIIYYCNRRVLHEQITVRSKVDIERFFGNVVEIKDVAAEYLHILTYQSSELKGNYPSVSIKDEDTEKTVAYEPDDILFYIFDEAHYFVNDASINSGTNFWYEKKFGHGISIFLTATPKPLIAFLAGMKYLRWESNAQLHKAYKTRKKLQNRAKDMAATVSDVFAWDCRKRISVKMPSSKALADAAIRHCNNPLQNWFDILDQAYQDADQTYRTYHFGTDYSYIDPLYFTELEELLPVIISSGDEKWLIFVDDEEVGLQLATRLKYAEHIATAFISSSRVKHAGLARDMYEEIVASRSFPVKVLITTPALDCGIDLIDKQLKHVVIVSDNEASFLQMLGRKRVEPGERVRLYIKVFKYQTIHNRYTQCTKELQFLLALSLKNEIALIRSGRSTAYRDGNTYGSALSAAELNRLVDDFVRNPKPALVKRVAKDIVPDCNRHVKTKEVNHIMNYDMYLSEYDYSNTAFLNLVYRMHDYHKAMLTYRSENELFVKLCEFVYICLTRIPEGLSDRDLKNVILFDSSLAWGRASYFPFMEESKPSVTQVDFRENVRRDDKFFLRHQLRWIGKEYDINCWLGYEGRWTALICYLDSVEESEKWLREDDTWHEQRDFARRCMDLMLDLPEVPTVLLNDRSRYVTNPETYPALNKLNKCFKWLGLPYKLESKQRRYENDRKMCWKLVKNDLNVSNKMVSPSNTI